MYALYIRVRIVFNERVNDTSKEKIWYFVQGLTSRMGDAVWRFIAYSTLQLPGSSVTHNVVDSKPVDDVRSLMDNWLSTAIKGLYSYIPVSTGEDTSISEG